MLHPIKCFLTALILSSTSLVLTQPAQAGHRFDHLGEGVYLSTECQRSRVVGFVNTTVTMTVVANGEDDNGEARPNQRLLETFLLGRDPASDEAIRVIERYPTRSPQRDSYTVNLRGASAERVEIVDGSIKVNNGGEDIFIDVPEFTVSCD